ncbi:MAG: hypothetical protein MUF87_14670 [Anaerolineae bacterium]|jgi:sirohydrochlorin cobaltochelatase|nr:hypothetical protein [Anaerolineae bacterium]
MSALILAGHGSQISPNTAGLVWHCVDQIRTMRVYDEVSAAFWKEAPSFHQVIDTIEAQDVTIVPLFTARGYFTQTVIPHEMGLTGAISQRKGRTIRYADGLPDHPYFQATIDRRVHDALQGLDRDQVTIAIIGHGTKRNQTSRQATERQGERLRVQGIDAITVYLDDDPAIPAIYTLTTRPIVIAVPYFLAFGSHTAIDLPRELGLPFGQTEAEIHGRRVIYARPLGVEVEVILDIARQVGSPLREVQAGSPWESFPKVGRDRLIQAVYRAGSMRFGELRLTRSEVRVWGDESAGVTITNPAMLRAWTRDLPFRPLATAKGLMGGWRVKIDDPLQLAATVETIYPGAIADWAGSGSVRSLAEVAARQTGKFAMLGALSLATQQHGVETICAGCVRHATWFDRHSPHDAIPCYEPCNYWMSQISESQAEA